MTSWSRDIDQRILCFHRCQLTLYTKDGCLCWPSSWSMAAVVVAVVCTRPRTIPLAMITIRISIHGFPLLSYLGMGLRLNPFRATGALL